MRDTGSFWCAHTSPTEAYPARQYVHRSPATVAHRPGGSIAPAVVAFVAGLSFAQTALAAGVLPQGGHYVAGAGTIASQGDALTVTQPTSSRGVIDWTGFSIGKGNTVSFDNGSGGTL